MSEAPYYRRSVVVVGTAGPPEIGEAINMADYDWARGPARWRETHVPCPFCGESLLRSLIPCEGRVVALVGEPVNGEVIIRGPEGGERKAAWHGAPTTRRQT